MKTTFSTLCGIALLALVCQGASTRAADFKATADSLVGTWEAKDLAIVDRDTAALLEQLLGRDWLAKANTRLTLKRDGTFVTVVEMDGYVAAVSGTWKYVAVDDKNGVLTSIIINDDAKQVKEQGKVRWLNKDTFDGTGDGMRATWSRSR
jgi:arylsulfatase A-like enzyme